MSREAEAVFAAMTDEELPVAAPLTAAEVEVTMGDKQKKVTLLQPGLYLAHGTTRELFRENGEPWRGDRRFEAQQKLALVDPNQWAIVEVTANNFAWGE